MGPRSTSSPTRPAGRPADATCRCRKFYSGEATYHATFDAPGAAAGSACGISLGVVHDIARVTLNGRDLGVAWCAPWRVDVPAGVLRAAGNDLPVTVADRWINRLVGDAGLPARERVTWTTSSPYKAASPLVPAGLIWPVTVVAP